MSKVTFHPKEGTEYDGEWPKEVIGDGHINLRLWDITGTQCQFGQYVDQFGDSYEFFGPYYGPWTVEVGED